AIKTALQKISEHDRALGELLNRCIRTGIFCRFASDSNTPITWQFSIDERTARSATSRPNPVYIQPEDLLGPREEQTTFIGRETEQGLLRKVLEQVISGTARVVMVVGPPGVGKTRIATEFAREAAQRGTVTLAGSCYDRPDAVPFIPFVEMFENALAQTHDRRAFRD